MKSLFRKTVGCIGAIVFIVFGLLSAFNGFTFDPESAFQQTVQYLLFVCAAIFIVGGMILYQLDLIALKLDQKQSNVD